MNEEEKTITANEPASEKQTKPAKPKRTDEEKRLRVSAVSKFSVRAAVISFMKTL